VVVAAALPGDLGLAGPAAWVRPLAAARRVLDFLECDRAAEPVSRLTAALAGYEELARATPQLATVTLLWMTTPEREAEARRTLPHAAAWSPPPPSRDGATAEAVWLPTGTTGLRQRLVDLAQPSWWA
jgi:hypothetical protein